MNVLNINPTVNSQGLTVELRLRRYKCSAEIKENVLHFKKFRRSLRVCKYTVPVYHSKNEIQLMLFTLDGPGQSHTIYSGIFQVDIQRSMMSSSNKFITKWKFWRSAEIQIYWKTLF